MWIACLSALSLKIAPSICAPIHAYLGLFTFAPREVACQFIVLQVLIPKHANVCAISLRAYMQKKLIKHSFLLFFGI
jgi:hypothetical protein